MACPAADGCYQRDGRPVYHSQHPPREHLGLFLIYFPCATSFLSSTWFRLCLFLDLSGAPVRFSACIRFNSFRWRVRPSRKRHPQEQAPCVSRRPLSSRTRRYSVRCRCERLDRLYTNGTCCPFLVRMITLPFCLSAFRCFSLARGPESQTSQERVRAEPFSGLRWAKLPGKTSGLRLPQQLVVVLPPLIDVV